MKNENAAVAGIAHNIVLESREKMSVSGVEEVLEFDENEIVMETSMGCLIIRGEDLRIEKLNIETGDTVIEGLVSAIEYTDSKPGAGSFWSRVFK